MNNSNKLPSDKNSTLAVIRLVIGERPFGESRLLGTFHTTPVVKATRSDHPTI